jgi:hypothetical protein
MQHRHHPQSGGRNTEGQREERNADTEGTGLEVTIYSHATQTGGLQKPEERQQPQPERLLMPKPKPKQNPAPTVTLRTTSMPIAVTTSMPTPTRLHETVPRRNQNKQDIPATTPTPRSSLADRRQIVRRDENVPFSVMMDPDIVSVIIRALCHQQAPAHIRIMNARRHQKGGNSAIKQKRKTDEITLQYCNIGIPAARTVDNCVIHVNANESWERVKIHVGPLLHYKGKGIEGLQKMREEFEAENERIAIPTNVGYLANLGTTRQRRQNGKIAVSSVVFGIKGNKVEQRWVQKGKNRPEYGTKSKRT